MDPSGGKRASLRSQRVDADGIRAAQRTVARHAVDEKELWMLLEMLGIAKPVRRRANTAGGTPERPADDDVVDGGVEELPEWVDRAAG